MIATDIQLTDTTPFNRCYERFRPRSRPRILTWARTNIINNEGRPYDHGAYPHIGAPGGPFDALDDPTVRDEVAMWASRLGKTFFGQCGQLYFADSAPAPMMFASSQQTVALDVVQRTYEMIRQCPSLAECLPPKHRQKQDCIDLGACEIVVGWSRSTSSLADKNVKYGHANELDKWEHVSTSKEADPFKLFTDRGKSFAGTRKFVHESTPALKGSSRIEDLLQASWNCRYYVPCPHCGRYQALRMGEAYYRARQVEPPAKRGGLVWDTPESGRTDVATARRTARYECEHCNETIEDWHRADMMRSGVWVPEGCTVDDDGARREVALNERQWRGWRNAQWVKGEPRNDGPMAGHQLSSLVALSLNWGDIAAEFVNSSSRVGLLRNFVNQWLGETWETIIAGQTWQQLGARLIDHDLPHGIIPPEYSLITVGVDRQQDHFAYVVDAWGPDRRSHTIDYGTCEDFDDLLTEVLTHDYRYPDGTRLRASMVLIDSGYKPAGVYEFVKNISRQGVRGYPCKGASKAMNTAFIISELGKDTSSPGQKIVRVDTITTQDAIDQSLHHRTRGQENSTTLYAGSMDAHRDFLEQLLNETSAVEVDKRNYEREAWNRIDETIPNDYRDCKRYAFVAMLVHTRGRALRARDAPTQDAPAKKPEKPKRNVVPSHLNALQQGGWWNR